MKRIEQDRVARHQDVEEVPERGQGLILGRRPVGDLVEEPAGQLRLDLSQLQPFPLAPGQEPPQLPGG